VRLPQLNDYDRRWRRVIFDAANSITFQRTDDSFARYQASVDPRLETVVLNRLQSRTWRASFAYDRSTENRLILDGVMDNHRIHAQLERLDLDRFRLLRSDFRWIRPPDPPAGRP